MGPRSAQDQWLALISEAEKALPTRFPEYKAPGLATPDFAQYIDHTSLKLDVKKSQIEELCEEAKKYKFKTVSVRLPWVKVAIEGLKGSSVAVACVVGFPEGTQAVSDKVREAGDAIDAGAAELDMVLNWPALKAKDYGTVYEDIVAVRTVAPDPVVLKVILETSQLSRSEIVAGCKIAEYANSDFVKTSTGFNGPGASFENVRLMKAVVGAGVKIKASGGVKTINGCVAMIEAGAERIGTSSGVSIMNETKSLVSDITYKAGETLQRNHKPLLE